jgi:predicted Na+-dependent transporter
METIKAFLDLAKVAHPQSHKNLTLFPLLAPETGEPDFLTLEEALNQALVALVSSFGLGLAIEKMGRIFQIDPRKVISLVLLGTNKNTGLAAGLALALYGDRTALPATVSTIFMIVYIVWLGFKQRKSS